eukprot:gene8586-9503_t
MEINKEFDEILKKNLNEFEIRLEKSIRGQLEQSIAKFKDEINSLLTKKISEIEKKQKEIEKSQQFQADQYESFLVQIGNVLKENVIPNNGHSDETAQRNNHKVRRNVSHFKKIPPPADLNFDDENDFDSASASTERKKIPNIYSKEDLQDRQGLQLVMDNLFLRALYKL